MTASGFVLFVFGFALAQVVANPYTRRVSAGEWVSGVFMLAGGGWMAAGIVVWLWRAMP